MKSAFPCLGAAAALAAAPAAAQTPVDIEFQVPPGFAVERASPIAKSLIAMTFDGAGRVFLAVENGPILLAADKDGDGIFETVTTWTNQVTYCMGLAWIEGALFASGNVQQSGGPVEHGVYRMADADGNLTADHFDKFAPVSGMGEHGTHAIVLGPDRHLYIAVGNHSSLGVPFAPDSPLLRGYEGSILPPLYDPNGHAVGCRYPGGTVARVDLEGKRWTYHSVGYRNHYDIAFNAAGDLFTFDSDMEWDLGTPWYRDVRVVHVVTASDYGWRTSSTDWPETHFDSLPPMVNIGRGSPTGVTVYEHHRFPERYRGAVIVQDWSQARVFAVLPRREGATYGGEHERFIAGKPQLNVTDTEVGPDGALYFTTGGRGVVGTLYRMVYKGADLPPPPPEPADGVEKAIRMPQSSSAWAREACRALRDQAGDRWGPALASVARDAGRPAADRLSAVDLLRMHGPAPDEDLLLALARDADGAVRSHAAAVLGERLTPKAVAALTSLLEDSDLHARRRAGEALGGTAPDAAPRDALYAQLGHSDRWVRYAARTALERTGSPEALRERILQETDPRRAVEGLLLLARTAMPLAGSNTSGRPWKPPAEETQDAPLFEKAAAILAADLPPDVLLDLLRLFEVAIELRGEPPPPLREKLAGAVLARFPHADPAVSRALAVLLGRWAPPGAIGKLLDAVDADPARARKIYYAYCLRAIEKGWTVNDLRRLLDWFETAGGWTGGNSFRGYIEAMRQACLGRISLDQTLDLVRTGALGPLTLASLVSRLQPGAAGDQIEQLKTLYARIEDGTDPDRAERVREAVVRALVKTGHPALEGWFRQMVQNEPRRRDTALVGLVHFKNPADTASFLEGLTRPRWGVAEGCVQALLAIGPPPQDAAGYRAVLDAARRHGHRRGWQMIELLKAWTKQGMGQPGPQHWEKTLQDWEEWLAKTYPSTAASGAAPGEAVPPPPAWAFDATHAFLARSAARKGSPARGAAVYKGAQCANCHRLGDVGTGLGPDLTGVARRFNEQQILESIVFPSRVVSDQYRATIIDTQDGRIFEGRLIEETPERFVLLQNDGRKATIDRNEMFSVKHSKTSLMPEGLLAPLALEDVKDLLAYVATDGKAGEEAPAQDSSWEPLFAGEGLAGWDGEVALWRARNGVLAGRADGLRSASYLTSRASYRDFELSFDVRLASGAPSAIQYRSKTDPAKRDPVGYRVVLGGAGWGRIEVTDERFGTLGREDAEAVAAAVDAEGWNHVVIRAEGERHTVEINGSPAAEARDARHAGGVLAFQLRAGASADLRIAHARIRRLP